MSAYAYSKQRIHVRIVSNVRKVIHMKEKPLEIKILVVLEIIYGLAVWGVCAYYWPPVEWWHFAVLFWSVVPYYLAYLIWIGKFWAWNVAMIIAILVIIGSAGWFLLLHGWTGLVDVFCNIPIVYFLTRPQVKVFFRGQVNE